MRKSIQYSFLAGAVFVVACLLQPAGCSGSGSWKRRDRGGLTPGASYGAIWDDPARCADMVGHGRRVKIAPGHLRLVTWNVRWFPDGKPGDAPSESRTNVEWVACVIAYLDPALLALQEIKLTDRGIDALARLTERLQQLTGATWAWHADTCPVPSMQHVAILYRKDRVAVSEVVSHGELDTTGKPDGPPDCPGKLRPGLGAYVKSLGGGLDFHLVDAHLDSGRKTTDFEHRQQAWTVIDSVFARRQKGTADADLVWAGDFNTMGCENCEVSDNDIEVEHMREALAALTRPLRLVSPSPRCSAYYRGDPELLDGFALAAAMEEAADANAVPSGVCGASSCRSVASEELPVFRSISDHCPVILDLMDVDQDPDAVSAAPAEAPTPK